jgi:signal peptidase I
MFLLAFLFAVLTVTSVVLITRALLVAVTVMGRSMEPTLRSGDVVIAARWKPVSLLRRGSMVLIRGYGGAEGRPSSLMIKRVSNLPGDHVEWAIGEQTVGASLTSSSVSDQRILRRGEVFVLSDNESGIDSRTWGPIPLEAVAGLVLWHPHSSSRN